MCSAHRVWWDREINKDGMIIREDVRHAARDIWAKACRLSTTMAGDDTDALEIMEHCVTRVTRYLNDRNYAPFSQKTAGLLLVAFRRELLSRMARLRRTEPIETQVLEDTKAPDWATEVELRVDLEKFVAGLSERARTILAMRDAGHEWDEIAVELGVSASTAKNSFSVEVRRARALLAKKASPRRGQKR